MTRTAVASSPSRRVLGCGVYINTRQYLIHNDYRRVSARLCVCTCDTLLICCLPFVFFLSLLFIREIPPELPVSHNAPWPLSGRARGKEVLGCEATLVQFNLQSPLCFPDLVSSAILRWSYATFLCVVNMQTQLYGWNFIYCSVRSTWERNLPGMKT